MDKLKITFVTGNKGKLSELKAVLDDFVSVSSLDVDLPELQGTPREISVDKCQRATHAIEGPVLGENTKQKGAFFDREQWRTRVWSLMLWGACQALT